MVRYTLTGLAVLLIGWCGSSQARAHDLPVPITRLAAHQSQVAAENQAAVQPIKPIGAVSTDITAPQGRLPTDVAAQTLPQTPLLAADHAVEGPWTGYHWVAPGVAHRPLYFENIALERHGYSLGLLQPLASAAHFAGNTAILPYRMGAEPPCRSIYTLGHQRPGTPTPLYYHRPPFSVAGGLAQAGAVTGLIFLLP